MTSVITHPITEWNSQLSVALQEQATAALEKEDVLFFPQLTFTVDENESKFLSPDIVDKSKNVGFNIHTNRVQGSRVLENDAPMLQTMMNRFANSSRDLVNELLPHYAPDLIQARTSFRPVEISGRPSSWRKDDTRLHIDAFPSTPVQGKRILRVFSNINANGNPRSWRLGTESFEHIAKRFIPSIPDPLRGSSHLLHLTGITKGRRSTYDHFMLQLHDKMKSDAEYQEQSEQIKFDFPSGSTWMCFTDSTPHAVLSGQYLMEQSFYLPISAMRNPSLSPLKILERIKGRELV